MVFNILQNRFFNYTADLTDDRPKKHDFSPLWPKYQKLYFPVSLALHPHLKPSSSTILPSSLIILCAYLHQSKVILGKCSFEIGRHYHKRESDVAVKFVFLSFCGVLSSLVTSLTLLPEPHSIVYKQRVQDNVPAVR